MEDFYSTLPSNSSIAYYPENRPSHYRTRLAKNLELDHRWEVAVLECRVPVTWKNVVEGENIFSFQEEKHESNPIMTSIPTGYYASLEKLVAVINERTPTKRKPVIKVVDKQHFVVLHGYFRFHPMLGNVLGVNSKQLLGPRDKNPHRFENDIHHHSLYVYGDFVQPQLVGDTTAPLLCRMGVDRVRRGEFITYSPRHLSYIPVIGGFLHSPLVYLRDESGREVSFQTGIVSLLLHFRQRL